MGAQAGGLALSLHAPRQAGGYETRHGLGGSQAGVELQQQAPPCPSEPDLQLGFARARHDAEGACAHARVVDVWRHGARWVDHDCMHGGSRRLSACLHAASLSPARARLARQSPAGPHPWWAAPHGTPAGRRSGGCCRRCCSTGPARPGRPPPGAGRCPSEGTRCTRGAAGRPGSRRQTSAGREAGCGSAMSRFEVVPEGQPLLLHWFVLQDRLRKYKQLPVSEQADKQQSTLTARAMPCMEAGKWAAGAGRQGGRAASWEQPAGAALSAPGWQGSGLPGRAQRIHQSQSQGHGRCGPRMTAWRGSQQSAAGEQRANGWAAWCHATTATWACTGMHAVPTAQAGSVLTALTSPQPQALA